MASKLFFRTYESSERYGTPATYVQIWECEPVALSKMIEECTAKLYGTDILAQRFKNYYTALRAQGYTHSVEAGFNRTIVTFCWMKSRIAPGEHCHPSLELPESYVSIEPAWKLAKRVASKCDGRPNEPRDILMALEKLRATRFEYAAPAGDDRTEFCFPAVKTFAELRDRLKERAMSDV